MSEYKRPEQVLQENLKPQLEVLEGAVNAMKDYANQECLNLIDFIYENLKMVEAGMDNNDLLNFYIESKHK